MEFKRIFSFFVCFIMIFSCCTIGVFSEEASLEVSNGCHSVDANMSFLGQTKLVDNAQSVFVFETNSQTLMYGWNADVQMYPASLVKIMTALIVLEQCTLTDSVTVSQSAVDSISYDAVKADLQAGEVLTVNDLLHCMLVSSANDAAAVLAEFVAGTQSEFVSMMNQRAAELGCTATNYTNVHGLHDDLQLTTARDVCRILAEALKHPQFREIFGCIDYLVPATTMSEQRSLSSNNFLMNGSSVGIYYDGRVTGGRSGETYDRKRCIATVSESGNMELICIVMGSQSTYSTDGYTIKTYGGFPETSKILDLCYDGFSRQQVICKDQVVRQQTVINGDCDAFVAANEDFYAVLPAGVTIDQLTFRYTDAPGSTQAPIQKGQNMVSVQVWYNTMCIAETEMYALNDVPVIQSKLSARQNDAVSASFWKVVFVILIVIAVLTVAVLLALRFTAKKRIRRRNHRRRSKPNGTMGRA